MQRFASAPVTRRRMAVGLASATLLGSLFMPPIVRAQDHPQMANVVPDGGTGAIQGKVLSIDPASRAVTIAPREGDPLTLYAAPSVRLDNVEQGDRVDAEYMRQVFWVVTAPSAPAPSGATETLGEVAHRPGGIGPGPTQVSGRVLRINQGRSFDVVDATGGGVYTIVVQDPSKLAMLGHLQVGNAITVSLTPLTITAMEKCGWFGCS